METNVYKTMLPVSVYSTAFGILTIAGCRQATVKNTLSVYCSLVAVAWFAYCVIYLLITLRNIHVTSTSVAHFLIETASVLMLSWYFVKFIRYRDTYGNILDNIDCVDKRLEKNGVRVPHTRNLVTCAVYIVLKLAHTILAWMLISSYKDFNKSSVDLSDEFFSRNALIARGMFSFIMTIITSQFNFLLYTIEQRLRLLLYSLHRQNKNVFINIAWMSSVPVGHTWQRSFRNTRKAEYFTDIKLALQCIQQAYALTVNFYSAFSLFQFSTVIYLATFFITISVFELTVFHLVHVTIRLTEFAFYPTLMCVYIGGEFHSLYTTLNSYLHDNKLKPFEENIKLSLQLLLKNDNKFDCGFFEINVQLVYMIFDFVTLFVTSLLT